MLTESCASQGGKFELSRMLCFGRRCFGKLKRLIYDINMFIVYLYIFIYVVFCKVIIYSIHMFFIFMIYSDVAKSR